MESSCLSTGHIALIRGDVLHCVGFDGHAHQHMAGDHFAIVSDSHVKWRGGKQPSDEEELKVSIQPCCCCLKNSTFRKVYGFM